MSFTRKVLRFRHLFVAGMIVLLAHGISVADFVSTSTAVVQTAEGSDGTDYWGVVDAGGATINGMAFTPGQTAPVAGDLAGRDVNSSNSSGNVSPVQAIWTLMLPAGTLSVDSIQFAYTVAAADQFANWAPGGSLQYDLNVGATTVTHQYTATDAGGAGNGPLGLSGGAPTVTAAGINNTINAADVTGAPSIQLVFTADSSFSNEEFWTRGVLSANVTVVPEPGSCLVLLVLSGVGMIRRNRRII